MSESTWIQLELSLLVVCAGPPVTFPPVPSREEAPIISRELAGRPVEEWRARVAARYPKRRCAAVRARPIPTPDALDAAAALAGRAIEEWWEALAPVYPTPVPVEALELWQPREAPAEDDPPAAEEEQEEALAASPTRTRGYSLGSANKHPTLSAAEKAESANLKIHLLPELPATYGDCKGMPRPCYFFRCRTNLWLDVNPESGSIRLNFPGLDPTELEHTCAIDVALERAQNGSIYGPHRTLLEVADLMNVTEVWAGQLISEAVLEVKAKLGVEIEAHPERGTDEVDEYADEPVPEDDGDERPALAEDVDP